MNQAFCNKCDVLVPARHEEREGQIFLVKECPQCGATDTLLSSNAASYWKKRGLDEKFRYGKCDLDCHQCQHKEPNIIFLDLTNRCNMNCPICINNTPAMGFQFEPPIEYFDTIFRHYAGHTPKPSVQLFGGEPTVRHDLFDIIRLARGYGLPTRLVTNGVRLADPDYCRRVIESKTTILISYDGANEEMHRVLRASVDSLKAKQRAIENIGRIGRGKVVLMTVVARGFNDRELPEMFRYCHDRRDFVRGIYFMPLAHAWNKEDFKLEAERTTTEDLEQVICDAFPEDPVEFLPTNVLGRLPSLFRALGVHDLPFVGGHPNCESMYLLLSDGVQYRPLAHYLRITTEELVRDLLAAEERMAVKEQRLERGAWGKLLGALRLKRASLKLSAWLALARVGRRNVRINRALGPTTAGSFLRGLGLLGGMALRLKSKKLLRKFTRVQSALQIIVLPFGDKENMDTDRLQRCPAAFAYVDAKDGQVKHIPNCVWGIHKNRVLKEITDAYAAGTFPIARPPAATPCAGCSSKCPSAKQCPSAVGGG